MLYAYYTIENILSIIMVHNDLSAHRRSDRPRLEEEFAVRCIDPDDTWTMVITKCMRSGKQTMKMVA